MVGRGTTRDSGSLVTAYRPQCAWAAVLVAGLLLATGASKILFGSHTGSTMLASPWLRYAIAASEVTVAVALVARRTRQVGAYGAMCLGLAFSMVGAHELSRRDPRPCGCFGGLVSVAPWVGLLIAGMIVALSVCVLGRRISE
jgi:hypothetical protein